MKKTYYLLAMLPLWLLSCSSGSDDNGPEVLKPINDVSIDYGQERFINEVGDKKVSFENDFIASTTLVKPLPQLLMEESLTLLSNLLSV